MNQNLYEKHQMMKFERIELIVPAVIAIVGVISMILAHIFEWNKMAFNAIVGMIVVCVLYKVVSFILNLWEYNSYGNDDMSKNQ